MEHQYRRNRGEGSIYTKPRSPFLWIKYYKAGKPIRESTRTEDSAKAARLLRQRLAEIESNPAESPRVEQLADNLFRDYHNNVHRSLDDVQARWRLHLQPLLGLGPSSRTRLPATRALH
jgi:hypothetical protein